MLAFYAGILLQPLPPAMSPHHALKLSTYLLVFSFLIVASPHQSAASSGNQNLQTLNKRILRRSPAPLPVDPHAPHVPANDTSSEGSVICRAEGLCETCPESSVNEPFCQPYGNRRLIKCLPLTEENERLLEEAARLEMVGKPVPHNLGETPAWEACGKVIAKEKGDYWEFILCNAFFASLALFIVLARSKQLAAVQYRRLAARIGL